MKSILILAVGLTLSAFSAKAQQTVIQSTHAEEDARNQAGEAANDLFSSLHNPGGLLFRQQQAEWLREHLASQMYLASSYLVTFFRDKDGSVKPWEADPLAAPKVDRKRNLINGMDPLDTVPPELLQAMSLHK